jgi:hypothetical protein
MADRLIPCATCPWRVDKDATTIPRYIHEKACNLINTVGPGDDFRQIMACHHSEDGQSEAEKACKGYLAQVGHTNINVRILMARGKLPPIMAIIDACDAERIELELDYQTVLEKLSNSLADASARSGKQ